MRLDDIGLKPCNLISLRLLEEFRRRNIPLSIGVISVELENDTYVESLACIKYLQRQPVDFSLDRDCLKRGGNLETWKIDSDARI